MHTIKDIVKQLIGKSLDAYNTNYTKVVNTRIDNIVAQAGNDNTEIVDARIDSAGVTHTTLNNRILAETKMTDEKLIEYTGSSLSVDDTMPGYLQNIEIKGNTIQNEDNLEDIRSVGDKVEGQELYEIPVLSVGKNLFNGKLKFGEISDSTGQEIPSTANTISCEYTKVPNGSSIGIRGFDTTSSYAMILEYDSSYNFIQKLSISATGLNNIKTLNPKTNYIKFKYQGNQPNLKISVFLNETVATPYEPYQEDKLTILSPTQLEKVGDVRDRIIEKDGVWGVEKNVGEQLFDSNSTWTQNSISENYIEFICQNIIPTNIVYGAVSSNFIAGTNQHNIRTSGSTGKVIIQYKISEAPTLDATEFTNYVANNPFIIKYVLVQPTFIPLPHDQQVKLRTFANKTNISFGCEIEGTIKAQVPKSLGATVNTHTEQISNLNKELDRVKKLEESTVSTVETESDFATVEATSNGYFEDVQLEGKTLVNLWDINKMNKMSSISVADNYVTVNADGSWIDCHPRYTAGKVPMLKPNTEYTVIAHIKNNTLDSYMSLNVDNANRSPFTRNITIEQGFTGYYICKLNTKTDLSKADTSLRCQVGSSCTTGSIVFNCILLEGDHTQNPPNGYIEGLKSVGQDVDEIVVSSVKNLLDYTKLVNKVTNGTTGVISINNNRLSLDVDNRIEINSPYISVKCNDVFVAIIGYVEKDGTPIYDSGYLPLNTTSKLSLPSEVKYITINAKAGNETPISKEVLKNVFIYHQADKKQLLYYNNETQTWEKPILREWDSIEKHADGKYYYHQRSGEVVLNGSENWGGAVGIDNDNFKRYQLKVTGIFHRPYDIVIISDKFKSVTNKEWTLEEKKIEADSNFIYITTDILIINDFKQWLQTNNVTVVYQLAQEKVYECTNIDLITYANETNYIVESGVIVPKTTLKVHNNISNVVSLLQKKVSLLESNMTKYMITQNRMQLASTYSTDSVTFKVDYALCSAEVEYNEDLYNLILNNILVGKDNYDYDKMFTMILDYASWNQISWEQFDILVGVMDIQHNPPVEEETTEDESIEETPVE